jgi:hypothetical protein
MGVSKPAWWRICICLPDSGWSVGDELMTKHRDLLDIFGVEYCSTSFASFCCIAIDVPLLSGVKTARLVTLRVLGVAFSKVQCVTNVCLTAAYGIVAREQFGLIRRLDRESRLRHEKTNSSRSRFYPDVGL